MRTVNEIQQEINALVAEKVSAIIAKYNKPLVTVVYGYDYDQNPTFVGDEKISADNFQIADVYTKQICVENQTTTTGKGSYYFAGCGEGLKQDYDIWEKKVLFSDEAKSLCKELSDEIALHDPQSNMYNQTDHFLFKLGFKKEHIFTIIVEQK
jgi:hypothetical protein